MIHVSFFIIRLVRLCYLKHWITFHRIHQWSHTILWLQLQWIEFNRWTSDYRSIMSSIKSTDSTSIRFRLLSYQGYESYAWCKLQNNVESLLQGSLDGHLENVIKSLWRSQRAITVIHLLQQTFVSSDIKFIMSVMFSFC